VVVGGLLVFWPGHETDWLGMAVLSGALLPQVVPFLRRRAASSG
jgi:UPF0716 family protein affecting phage T7 exclusion